MKKLKILLCFFAFLISCFFAFSASAHQPRMIGTKEPIKIENPELSQAFYEILSGDPQIFTIESEVPFLLYTNVLVPKSSNPDQRYGVRIYQINGEEKKFLKNIEPYGKKWELMHEEFANDEYYQGPEFEQNVEAGRYEIEVYGEENLGRYVLAVGKKEEFGISSLSMMLTILPDLKLNFFEVSPLTLVTGKLGFVLIIELVILILLSFLIWKLVRWILKKIFTKHSFDKNMGLLDRILRIVLGLVVMVFAIHYWSIILFIISSLIFYAGASGWCGLYTIIKVNTYKQKTTKEIKKKK